MQAGCRVISLGSFPDRESLIAHCEKCEDETQAFASI
jgi:hypothetical protein